MKYLTSLETAPGANALPHNPCKLLDLALPAGEHRVQAVGGDANLLGGPHRADVEGVGVLTWAF